MRRPIIALLPFALSALSLASGCSDDSSGQAAPVDRTSISSELANAYCSGMSGCCTDASITQSSDACLANAKAYFDEFFEEQDQLNQTYNPQNAGTCADSYQSYVALCGRIDDTESLRSFLEACNAIYSGNVKAGGSCTKNSECAGENADCSETYDDLGEVISGTCVIREQRAHGKQGDACGTTCTGSSVFESCLVDPEYPLEVETGCYTEDGLWCDGTACQPLGNAGDACDYGGCKEGLFCEQEAGVCSPLRGEGQACDYYSYDGCQEGLLCNGTECIRPGGVGDPCEYGGECESGTCTDANVCAANNATLESCSGLIGDDD